MRRTKLVLGFKSKDADCEPEVLYCGLDNEKAVEVKAKADAEGKLAEVNHIRNLGFGRVIRSFPAAAAEQIAEGKKVAKKEAAAAKKKEAAAALTEKS